MGLAQALDVFTSIAMGAIFGTIVNAENTSWWITTDEQCDDMVQFSFVLPGFLSVIWSINAVPRHYMQKINGACRDGVGDTGIPNERVHSAPTVKTP